MQCKHSTWKIVAKFKINKYEENAWNKYTLSHPNLQIARACLENIPSPIFWASADTYLDLVSHRHVQVRLIGNFGLNGGIPWLLETDGARCFTCREGNKTLCHFFFDCPIAKPNLTRFGVTCFQKLPILMLPKELKYHSSLPI